MAHYEEKKESKETNIEKKKLVLNLLNFTLIIIYIICLLVNCGHFKKQFANGKKVYCKFKLKIHGRNLI